MVWPASGLLLLVSVWQFAGPFLDPGSREAKQGLARMEAGDWVGAAEAFGRAQRVDANPVNDYNLGTAAFRGQNYKAAAEAFRSAAGSAGVPAGDAAYNLGNTLVEGQDFANALEAYRAALRENPDHEDARFNYELIRKMLEDQEQEQDQEQQEEDQEPNEDQDQEGENQDSQGAPPDSTQQQDSSQDEQNQNSDNESSPPDSSQGEQPQDPQDQDESEEDGEQDPSRGQPQAPEQLLSAEDARKLLDQITPSERDLIRQRLQGARKKAAEKDW